jgi:hypothetical protein
MCSFDGETYDEAVKRIDDSEGHYSYRCPYDSLSCERVVYEFGRRFFAVCYFVSDGKLYSVCSRYDAMVDVFRCHDGLPCNRFEGSSFGMCLKGGKLSYCCSRFERRR